MEHVEEKGSRFRGRFELTAAEFAGMVSGLLALSGAAGLWFSLPYRIEKTEESIKDHSEEIRVLEANMGLRNEKVASLVATVESIDRRTQRIEASLQGGNPQP